jgi:hypothetical protein
LSWSETIVTSGGALALWLGAGGGWNRDGILAPGLVLVPVLVPVPASAPVLLPEVGASFAGSPDESWDCPATGAAGVAAEDCGVPSINGRTAMIATITKASANQARIARWRVWEGSSGSEASAADALGPTGPTPTAGPVGPTGGTGGTVTAVTESDPCSGSDCAASHNRTSSAMSPSQARTTDTKASRGIGDCPVK